MKLKNIEIRDVRQMNGLTCMEWTELSAMLSKDKDDEMELKCPILF
ncbi:MULTISPECIES: hypothetical protein [Sphingobacterium]|jgi:hypothetical protein|nr:MULTISPECIES: hypothetical protein [Sphingobacterium]KKX46728.1 hypothetical protein L950_0230260 [Sphingobacterium sp. IITKGP-BTPF85]MCS3556608.1 hypothetical protein [Sphingobacterium sp. JUb21]MCW2260095.1 hypothetical protein [Sphingobacterium kitahiroshimense]TCQ99900.1 hypothetical protein EDF66_113125 [Sphingobacterium sp. JUb20]TCR11113.1 hypothetical protein EDF67_104206 [Sphingobacterium sp. JUb78]